MKKAGNKVISIIGARTKELLILEDEFAAISGVRAAGLNSSPSAPAPDWNG